MTQLEDRVRSGLRAEAGAVARVGKTAEPTTSDRPRISSSGARVAAVMAVVVLVSFAGVALLTGGGGGVANEPLPISSSVPAASDPLSPFVGTWVTTDLDGSHPTATIEVSEDGIVEITVHDDFASVCSGARSTMTGTGGLEGDAELIIPTAVLVCDDGSQPEALSGPPLEEQLLNLTFTFDPQVETLTDNFGSVWTREGAEEPEPVTMTDLETIEAGVAAFYSGEADRAAELFELADRTDAEIRQGAAYQTAIGGSLSLDCTESTPGTFRCHVRYYNALTEAIGFSDAGDMIDVVVDEGVITEFQFPEHSWMVVEIGIFFAGEGRFAAYEEACFLSRGAPQTEPCAAIQMEELDAWAAWHETFKPADRVEIAVEAWYRGDCDAALSLSVADAADCTASSLPARMIAYESILDAEASVENCEITSNGGEQTDLSCDVHYSNAMYRAVEKPPSVTTRGFSLLGGSAVAGPGGEPWYEGSYPDDVELRESFRLFAEGGELGDEYTAADCANERTPDCANLIMDNLDVWAAWHQANG